MAAVAPRYQHDPLTLLPRQGPAKARIAHHVCEGQGDLALGTLPCAQIPQMPKLASMVGELTDTGVPETLTRA